MSPSGISPDITVGPRLESYPHTIIGDVIESYACWSQTYGEHEKSAFELDESVILPFLGDLNSLTVLDVGCGTGRFSRHFASSGADVLAIDISDEMLEIAEREAKKSGTEIEFIHGDILTANLGQERFDLIFSSLAVTHVPDLTALFTKFKICLRAGGKVVVSDVHPSVSMLGFKVGFVHESKFCEVPHFTHRISDFFTAAEQTGMRVEKLHEFPDYTVLPAFFLIVVKILGASPEAFEFPDLKIEGTKQASGN